MGGMTVLPLAPGRDEMLAIGPAVLDELAGFLEGLPGAPSVEIDVLKG